MGQVYAVTSGKGGVGKSTVAVGLAFAFTKLNKKTLLVDMDEGLRCLDLMLGADKSAVFDLSDILLGKEMGDDPVSVRDAAAVSRKLNEINCPSRLIINNFVYSLIKRRIFRNVDDIIDGSGLQLLGVIPHSEELALLSVNHSVKPRGKSMAAFIRIARRLLNENILLPNLKKI